jgi:hypothetical protein
MAMGEGGDGDDGDGDGDVLGLEQAGDGRKKVVEVRPSQLAQYAWVGAPVLVQAREAGWWTIKGVQWVACATQLLLDAASSCAARHLPDDMPRQKQGGLLRQSIIMRFYYYYCYYYH